MKNINKLKLDIIDKINIIKYNIEFDYYQSEDLKEIKLFLDDIVSSEVNQEKLDMMKYVIMGWYVYDSLKESECLKKSDLLNQNDSFKVD